jgi:hypothetical protein|tara:strand:- start:1974 stop:2858 length:885 start_codon:yes stop_codon:yes gene_type:complete
MGKGSAPTTTKQEITQTNLPEYVRPYFERLLQRTESESKRDYEPYGGQRIADTSKDILDSEGMVRDIASRGLPGLDKARTRIEQGMAYQPRQFTGAEVDKYMSPYMDAVIDRQKKGAIDDYRQQIAGGRAGAIESGAFGGSREGVQRALGEEALYDRLADIEGAGRQQAFQQASGLFQSDRAADVEGQRLGIGAAGQYANLAERARAGDVESARLLETIGKAGMGRDQAGLDLAYQDFLRQQGYPQEKLGLLSSVLRGIPVQPSTSTRQMTPYDPFGRAIGLGLTALSGAKYFG